MENHLLQESQGRARGLYYTEILNIWVAANLWQSPAEGFARVHFNPSSNTKKGPNPQIQLKEDLRR